MAQVCNPGKFCRNLQKEESSTGPAGQTNRDAPTGWTEADVALNGREQSGGPLGGTVLESNPQKPGKTWKEKGLAKTTSGRDDQKKPVAAASYSILQRDEWLRRKKPRGKKFQSNSVVFCCCCSVSVALYSGEGSQPT